MKKVSNNLYVFLLSFLHFFRLQPSNNHNRNNNNEDDGYNERNYSK